MMRKTGNILPPSLGLAVLLSSMLVAGCGAANHDRLNGTWGPFSETLLEFGMMTIHGNDIDWSGVQKIKTKDLHCAKSNRIDRCLEIVSGPSAPLGVENCKHMKLSLSTSSHPYAIKELEITLYGSGKKPFTRNSTALWGVYSVPAGRIDAGSTKRSMTGADTAL